MFRLYFGLVLLALTLVVCEQALAGPSFLEGFVYGTPKNELMNRSDALPGSESFKDDIFFKQVPWAGFTWSAQCHFAANLLEGVTLYSPYEAAKLKRLSSYLKEQKFQLLGMVIDNKAIDIISLVKLGGQAAFKKRFQELVRAKTPTTISYEWFEGKSLTEDNLRMAASLSQLLTLVDMNLVQIEVSQKAADEKLEHAVLEVHFSCPILQLVREEKPQDKSLQ
ncbi:MAG: hypothetical protein IJT59_01080 [Desulfovibrionaceae bacterium]|nr:hypothetical protein [Desulfovibrionaceae bacterium]